MLARLRKSRSTESSEGFTLIELLIVIVILGILAAIVVFAIGKTRGDSVASSCKTNFKSVELSAEAIKTKSGKYPTGAYTDATTVANNELLTGSTAAAATPGNGALLKAYPSSADYKLNYLGVAAGDSFTITVQKGDGTAITAATGRSSTDTTGCDGL